MKLPLAAIHWCLLVSRVDGFHAEWEQYSDSASLPMSKRYRDELREKLSKIKMDSLDADNRRKVEKLKRLLEGDTEEEYRSPLFSTSMVTGIFLLFLLFLLYIIKIRRQKIYYASAEELRRARDLKYQ